MSINMDQFRRAVFLIFIIFHLTSIAFQGFWTTFDVFAEVNYEEDLTIPFLNWTRQNAMLGPYHLVTGTDTGYGFYGIRVAVEMYFRITYYDEFGKIIFQDRTLGLRTANGISRLQTYANRMGNYVVKTERMEVKMDGSTNSKYLDLRRDYTYKALKWLGRNSALEMQECASYQVAIMAISPRDIWDETLRPRKPNIFILYEERYHL